MKTVVSTAALLVLAACGGVSSEEPGLAGLDALAAPGGMASFECKRVWVGLGIHDPDEVPGVLTVDVRLWPGMRYRARVAMADWVLPSPAAGCGLEAEAAVAAREALHALVHFAPLTLSRVSGPEAGGLHRARLRLADGRDPGAVLAERGLARPMGAAGTWCTGS